MTPSHTLGSLPCVVCPNCNARIYRFTIKASTDDYMKRILWDHQIGVCKYYQREYDPHIIDVLDIV